MIEIWKDIENYEGLFQVSNLGRIKSLERVVNNHTGVIHKPERIIKQQTTYKGYKAVTLGNKSLNNKKTFPVHRLVAKAFIGNPNNKPQVNHKDGNKENNNVCNLEWCDNSENQIHAYKIGLNKVTGRAGKPKKKVLQIDIKTGFVVNEYESLAEASRKLGGVSNIGSCCRGKRNHVKGYKWQYKESEVM